MAQEKLDSSEFPFQTIQKRKILSKKRWPWASSLKWPKKSWILLSFPSKPSKSEKSSQKKKMALGIFPKMAQEKLVSSEFPFQTIQKRKILSKKKMALGIFRKWPKKSSGRRPGRFRFAPSSSSPAYFPNRALPRESEPRRGAGQGARHRTGATQNEPGPLGLAVWSSGCADSVVPFGENFNFNDNCHC